MIAIVWQFDVRKGNEKAFEQFYGADGEWTTMNRKSRSYLGTSFLRDQNQTSRYLMVEYWSEIVVYEEHKTYRSDEIRTLETRRRNSSGATSWPASGCSAVMATATAFACAWPTLSG